MIISVKPIHINKIRKIVEINDLGINAFIDVQTMTIQFLVIIKLTELNYLFKNAQKMILSDYTNLSIAMAYFYITMNHITK